MSTVSLSRG